MTLPELLAEMKSRAEWFDDTRVKPYDERVHEFAKQSKRLIEALEKAIEQRDCALSACNWQHEIENDNAELCKILRGEK